MTPNGLAERRARRGLSLALYLSRVRSNDLLGIHLIEGKARVRNRRSVIRDLFYALEVHACFLWLLKVRRKLKRRIIPEQTQDCHFCLPCVCRRNVARCVKANRVRK